MNSIPFEITKEEVLSLAAQKLFDAYYGELDISERAEEIIRSKVDKMVEEANFRRKIDDVLTAEMEKILGQEVQPVNIWGEREGKPTTIRAALAEQAKIFWHVRVDQEGRESTYGGSPRSEMLMRKLLKEEFEKAVKTNAELIVQEFKKALLSDAVKIVTDNINRLIK
jgi:hypothetical protein